MKRIASLFLLLFLLLDSFANAEMTAPDSWQTGFARTNGTDVNLRKTPVDGKVIASLPKGVAVYIFDQTDGMDGFTWYHVTAMHRYRNTKGWIRGDLLELPDTLFYDLVDVAADEAHIIALKADGTVIAAGTGHCYCTSVEGLYDAVDVAAGFYTSFAFFRDGSAWGRGLGLPSDQDTGFDDLVDATIISSNQFVGVHRDGSFACSPSFFDAYDSNHNPIRSTTYDATALENIVQIASGFNIMVCLTADGRPHMYGYRPELHESVEAWRDITKVSAYNHVVGLKSDGTVVAAGENRYGECDVADWTEIIGISASEDFTLGLRADGTVLVAGSNRYGASEVQRFSDIVQIEATRFFSVGRTAKGTLQFAGDFRFLDNTDVQGYLCISSGE